ncbi:MAG: adaptor protein MecA [Clostridia bacterium]|nr:adaptor protein MecA [Clostridia bacterium]
MKIVRLETDRIRVILSDVDLIDMNIDVQTLTPGSPTLSRFLCNILDAVRAETGFAAKEEQVIIEASQHEGGLVLTLSKISRAADKPKVRTLRSAKKGDNAVFEFLTFDDLLDMIKNTTPAYLISMRLYAYLDRFFLSVPKRRIPAIIYEYSLKSRKSPLSESIIAEYGKLLAGGYKLTCMAVGLKKMN